MADKYLGESTGKLGFGFMRLPRAGLEFDLAQIKNMVDAYLDAGFNYFDTAYVYMGSEEAMNKTLVTRHPRDKYTIADKLPMMMLQKAEEMPTFLETTLKRLGTDYLDFYMLHGIGAATNERAEQMGAWDYLKKLKQEGKIRHYGFSFHDTPEALEAILTRHPDAEFVQLQINYLDWDSKDVQSRRLYEVARKHNKPIIIMEPLKGGLLASETSVLKDIFKPAYPNVSVASWAARFAATLDGVLTMLSGMSSLEQMQDNLKTFSPLKPLSSDEQALVMRAAEALRNVPRVPCTGCKYCVENCPQKINIPALMDLYSDYLVYNSTANSEMPFMFATMNAGKPSDCITCKVCEGHCPQKIEISDILSKMVPLYEKK